MVILKVTCKYGAGDFAASPYDHVLITTEADCISKGYRILNGLWMKVLRYETSLFPYPEGGHLVRPATYITVSFPSVGVYNEVVWLYHVHKDFHAGRMKIGFERYEKSEIGVLSVVYTEIDDGGPSDNYTNIIDDGIPTDNYGNIIDGGTP